MDRYEVRMEEMAQCLRIIEQALDALRRASTSAPTCPSVSSRRRGSLLCRGGSPGQDRRVPAERRRPETLPVKLRAPGFSNLSLFAELAQGTLLADAVSILGSLDLVIPEIDR